MSRIAELKSILAHHVESLRFCEMELSGRKEKLEEIQAEIAALEAQERKPIEMEAAVDPSGEFTVLKHNFTYSPGTRFVSLIEKKPIVVNRKAASILSSEFGRPTCLNNGKSWLFRPAEVASFLRAAGIDAVPSDD